MWNCPVIVVLVLSVLFSTEKVKPGDPVGEKVFRPPKLNPIVTLPAIVETLVMLSEPFTLEEPGTYVVR